MNLPKLIVLFEKYILYIGLILFCLLINFAIDFVPYLNLEREIFLTAIYIIVVYYIAYKLHFSAIKLLTILTALTVVFSLITFTSFAEVLANVLYFVMFIEVIRILRSKSDEN